MSLEPAVYPAPPGTGNDNDVAVSTTSSSAIPHLLGANSDGMVTIACSVAFNIKFGKSDLADPGAVYPFPAGVYSFNPSLTRGQTHFKIRGSAAGASKWWLSHRGA
jgi:hypothetical protein